MAAVTGISGKVLIKGEPKSRVVRAFSYDAIDHEIDGGAVLFSKPLGQSISDTTTGDYSMVLLGGYEDSIFVVAFDDYGSRFVPNASVAVGDRIHPAVAKGIVYECNGAGTLPSSEPVWSDDLGISQAVGTASFIAQEFWQPIAHGPVVPEVLEVDLASLPHRYWRVVNITNAGNGYLYLGELQFSESDSVAIDGHTFTSSYADDARPIASMSDGNPSSHARWAMSGKVDQPDFEIKVDYGEGGEKALRFMRQAGYQNGYIVSCDIQCSDNDIDWYDVTSLAGLETPGSDQLSEWNGLLS